jgi:iron complex outermembrane receptor protein
MRRRRPRSPLVAAAAAAAAAAALTAAAAPRAARAQTPPRPAPPARDARPPTAAPRDTTPRDTTPPRRAAPAADEDAAALDEVVVTSTRGARRVAAEPTRVDVLDQEEVEEKTAMTPGNAAMLLGETGGVRVAATSPALGGANVRVQGLRGRYTQLLSDGLPLYGLSAEGLGLLQVPPVDLARVELIRGAASALYGPSALGGVVNFASRRPPAAGGAPVGELLVNQTTLDGSDLAYFDARPVGAHWGSTLLVTASRQRRRDRDRDGWADVPGYGRAVVRPRLFRTGPRGDLFATAGLTAEDRTGGTLGPGAAGGAFAQARATRRADAGVAAHRYAGDGRVLALRASATGEWRRLAFGAARERDRRTTLFAEAALTVPAGPAHEWVLGAAAQRDAYTPGAAADAPAGGALPGYAFGAPALFAQHTWAPGGADGRAGVTSSARLDAHTRYGAALSPRVSAVLRPGGGLTARLSTGLGTFAPTPFVEEAEEVGVGRVVGFAALRAERARHASADLGATLGPVEVNAAVYASAVRGAVLARGVPDPLADGDPVPGAPAPEPFLLLANAARPTRTHGAQLFARYRAGAYRVAATYDYQRATEDDPERPGRRRGVPLTPRHAAGLVAGWEREGGTGVSGEAYYTGRQPLADDPYRRESRPYVLLGVLARVRVRGALLFVNAENLGDVRQTRAAPLVRPAPGPGGRRTVDAWAPLEGAVVNAGVRLGL